METPTSDALQARTWDQFIGQSAIKHQLDIRIRAAVADQRVMGHVLLAGPPGFGKTTLSSIIAAQLNDAFVALQMPLKPKVLAAAIRQFQGGVILLDEIHRCSVSQQEDLLTLVASDPAECYVQLPSGQQFPVAATIIGATTEREKIIPPLYDRFHYKPFFEDYTEQEMGLIVQGMATRAGLNVREKVAMRLGRAAGGIPRNAANIVRAIRDLKSAGIHVSVTAVLEMAGVDESGLDRLHLEILRTLDILGGQAGLQTLSALLRLHPSVVTDKERLLLKQQLIQYGDRGRELTQGGYRKLAETRV
jgi:Holliday junction DNA helicase RuvB